MKYLLIALCSLACFSGTPSYAREPAHIETVLGSARLQGSSKLTWWGLDIYDAALYRAGNLSSPEFALDLRYQKSFAGTSIAIKGAKYGR